MNLASIDIGSNTVILLIAKIEKGNLQVIENRFESPRLGKNLTYGGKILDEKIEKLLNILTDYKKIIETYKCYKTIITATNAMRIAANSDEIISLVKNKLDMNVEIIEGKKEAELSYWGASSTLSQVNSKVVIDIGGGSTEIIYGNNNEILFKNSFQIGVVSLTEEFLRKPPYSEGQIELATEHLKKIFEPISFSIPKKIPTIAVAGTPTTLSCIKQGIEIYDENKIENSTLNNKDMLLLYNKLVRLTPKQILTNYKEIVRGREDVIFAGLLILKYFMELTKLSRIYISCRGLRYGNIIDYITKLK
ncbi:MAG: hypothetical protein CR986_06745 [Ignavibacteriae bacterium]|nr:MAG: hypothetical protein CR986_06745 [Ignavibacteriota bacterium]